MQKTVEEVHLMDLIKWLSERNVSFLTGFIRGRKVKNTSNKKYRAWFDGSFKQLLNIAAASFYVADHKGDIIYQYAETFTVNSELGSTFAEKKGYKLLLDFLSENNIDDVIIYGDCAHVMEYQGYDILHTEYNGKFKQVELIWIPRYLNFHADELCTNVYETNTYVNAKKVSISSIFYNKQNTTLVRNLLQDDVVKNKSFMKNDIKSHTSVLNAEKTVMENKAYETEEERIAEENNVYLFSFDGTDNFIKISLYQAVRLLERRLATVISEGIFITHYPSSELITFSNPLNLARWVLKNDHYPDGEEHMRNVKNQTVYLILNKGLKCISITTKQAKQLIINGFAKIFAEDVMISKLNEEELTSFDSCLFTKQNVVAI